MSIILAYMNGCSFCTKAKQELDQEIKDGIVTIIDSKDSDELKKYFKNELTGFPAFHNTENKIETTGFRDKENLFKILEYKIIEKYTPSGFYAPAGFYAQSPTFVQPQYPAPQPQSPAPQPQSPVQQPDGYNPLNPYGYNPFAYNPYNTYPKVDNISGCNNNDIYFSKRTENPKEFGVL